MKKLLKLLRIIQEADNKNRIHKLGKGFMYARRLNPYNPLSYLTIAVVFIVGLLAFGVVGIWKEIDNTNPFKWN